MYNHEGLAEAKLKHPSHQTFHKTVVSPEDEAKGVTRFYRWHIDAALYDLNPPKVTTLYGIAVPHGEKQVCRYDDGTGDELEVPLGTTAFVSGKVMFDILPDELKSFAVRTKVKYAPHPYVWMAPAHALSTGLGIEVEGLELPLEELPAWEESRLKILPIVCPLISFFFCMHLTSSSSGKTPQLATCTSKSTHAVLWNYSSTLFQQVLNKKVHSTPTGPISPTSRKYVDFCTRCNVRLLRLLSYIHTTGAHNSVLFKKLILTLSSRHENDFILFHNRGVLHTVVGAFQPDTVRAFHQCNLAASDEPAGPSPDDVKKYA